MNVLSGGREAQVCPATTGGEICTTEDLLGVTTSSCSAVYSQLDD